MKPVTLYTSRLILRYAENGDDEQLFSHYYSNVDSAKYLTREPHCDISQTSLFLTQWCKIPWSSDCNQFAWVISLMETKQAIGVFLVEIDEYNAQIHYGISPFFEGYGLITEAGEAVIAWLSEQTILKRIWTVCDIEHVASIRVLEKLKFKREGVLRKRLILPSFNYQARDCYCYGTFIK